MSKTIGATVRGILIDPHVKSIGYVDIPLGGDDGYTGIRDLVFPIKDGVDVTDRYLEHVTLHDIKGLAIYVDESGLLKKWEEQAFFSFPFGTPFAGRAVLLSEGYDNKRIDDGLLPRDVFGITVQELARVVRWMDPKAVRIPAPTFTTFHDDGTVKSVETLGGDANGEWHAGYQPDRNDAETATEPAFASGNGGDFGGAGASGKWEETQPSVVSTPTPEPEAPPAIDYGSSSDSSSPSSDGGSSGSSD